MSYIIQKDITKRNKKGSGKDLENFLFYQKEYYIKNKERIKLRLRQAHLKRKFGISETEYYEMLKNQDGKCAICEKEEVGDSRASYLSIDHNHESGEIRGLLCARCNRGLGYFRDDSKTLYNAFKYLNKFGTK